MRADQDHFGRPGKSSRPAQQPAGHLIADHDTEECLLGCVMQDGAGVMGELLEKGFTPEYFDHIGNRTIFEACEDLVKAGTVPEPATVAMKLREMGTMDLVGGDAIFCRLLDKAPTTLYARPFADRIEDLALRRGLKREGARIILEAGEEGEADALTCVSMAVQRLCALPNQARADDWNQAIGAASTFLDKRIDPKRINEKDEDEVSFGFKSMDRDFGPMRLGQLVVLAARPSVGKSSLARAIALTNAVANRQPVIFASLEVVGRTLALNMAQTLAAVNVKHLTPDSPKEDGERVRKAFRVLNTKNLTVLAGSNVSLASIQAKAALLKARGTPVRLVVIDYLQLMPDCAPEKGETRAGSVGRVSRALKAFALAQNCVVLVLSQLNRDSAKDSREPALYDLRESGDIEQDADKVILLHRPAENPSTGKAQSEGDKVADTPRYWIDVIQAKGRDDGTGRGALSFHRKLSRFDDIQYHE